MIEKIVNKFTVYDSEEVTALELIESLGNTSNQIIDELNNKTDLNGDHKGSWQGLNRPTLSEEGMRAQVEKNQSDISLLKNDNVALNNSFNELKENVNLDIAALNKSINEEKENIKNIDIKNLTNSLIDNDYIFTCFGQDPNRKEVQSYRASTHVAFPSMVNYNGKFVACYRKGSGHVSFDGSICIKTSTDNGNSWSAENIIISDSGIDYRDPMLYVVADGILLIVTKRLSNENREMKVYKSTDGGTSFIYKSNIPLDGVVNGNSQNKGSLTTLDNGEINLAVYYQGVWGVYLVKSNDNGNTWSFKSWVTKKAYNETALLNLGNNKMVSVLRQSVTDITTGVGAYCISNDNGITWSEPISLGVTIQAPTLTKIDDRILLCYRNPNTSQNINYKSEMQFILFDMNFNMISKPTTLFWTSNGWDMAYQDVALTSDSVYFIYYYPNGENISMNKLTKAFFKKISVNTHSHPIKNAITVIHHTNGTSTNQNYTEYSGIAKVVGNSSSTNYLTINFPTTVQRVVDKHAIVVSSDGNYNINLVEATNTYIKFIIKHIGDLGWSTEKEVHWGVKVII